MNLKPQIVIRKKKLKTSREQTSVSKFDISRVKYRKKERKNAWKREREWFPPLKPAETRKTAERVERRRGETDLHDESSAERKK